MHPLSFSKQPRRTNESMRVPQVISTDATGRIHVQPRTRPIRTASLTSWILSLIVGCLVISSGCQLGGTRRQEARYVEPRLPMTISQEDLIEHLNGMNAGLQSWRCMETEVDVSIPGMPDPKLNGRFACEAPSQFRLISDNFAASADFGSNQHICWAYVKPGESTVLTWKHEDSWMLQQLPGGMPRLEPDWLMTVLSLRQLDPAEYELQNAPLGSSELWLVAVEDAPDGSSLRRVIKVDPLSGTVREHALYDQNRQPLLRTQLSDYKRCGGYLLPHRVRIHFPQNRTELALTFRRIETDCDIEDALWQPPTGRNIEVVDLGDVMRRNAAFRRSPGGPYPQSNQPPDQYASNPASGTRFDGERFPARPEEPLRDSRDSEILLTGQSSAVTDSFEDPSFAEPQSDASASAGFEETPPGAPEFDIIAPSKPSLRQRLWPWSFRRRTR